jgi:photosystem I subunit 2
MANCVAFTSLAPSSQTLRGAFRGQQLQVAAPLRVQAPRRVAVRAETETKEAKKEKAPWKPPSLDPSSPSPIFGGSTGGLLRKAQIEEFYVITWDAKKEQIFEMPTGGAAIMRQGPNLLKLARKEQCLALLTQLRNKFKTDGAIYRVFPNGEVQYLHPKDGVYPEKVNQGRQAVGKVDRPIGKNPQPISVKFTGKLGTYDV